MFFDFKICILAKFIKYAKYAMDRGFEICYLLNSPKPFSEKDFNIFKDDFYRLLDDLYKNNIKHIKVGNTQVATLINEHNPDFKLSASTAFAFFANSTRDEVLPEEEPIMNRSPLWMDGVELSPTT